MPRRPDPELEGKILDTAQKLWKKGGDKALTMRAVARAARTNTPAVYRRFRDRDDILRGMIQRIRLEFAAMLEAAGSPEEGCERYLDYAVSHPREYELFYKYNYELYHSSRAKRAGVKVVGQPAKDAMRRKLTDTLGGSPADHERVLTALWMTVHGAAMLLIEKTIRPEEVEEARSAFTAAVAALLREARGVIGN